VVLEKSRAAVDRVGHRLVPVKHLDLERLDASKRAKNGACRRKANASSPAALAGEE
jgi:hypothetical protein